MVQEAVTTDADTLTQIAFTAKRHWKYPNEYYEIWKDELTITPKYIKEHCVYKAVVKEVVVGFYSIVHNKADFWAGEVFVAQGFWLEHIFILPEFHKKGIGRQMMEHAKIATRESGAKKLMIFVDPFAKGFYENIGATFQYNSPSSINGRKIPVYELKTKS